MTSSKAFRDKGFAGTEHYREKTSIENWQGWDYTKDVTALCDHIEERDKEIERLREVVRPLAKFCEFWERPHAVGYPFPDDWPLFGVRDGEEDNMVLTLGMLRQVSAALKVSKASPERSLQRSPERSLRTESSKEKP